jgi:hypothetical protein
VPIPLKELIDKLPSDNADRVAKAKERQNNRVRTSGGTMSTVVASTLSGLKIPAPGKEPTIGSLKGAIRIAEKTVELTTCAQLGHLLGKKMVWFGLTQAQERKHAYDAATNFGGRAFYIQFKASTKVLKTGKYKGRRLFQCQHDQMTKLVKNFGSLRNCCFYFLPNLGTLSELQSLKGDLIGNSYLIDVADIPNPVPATGRQSDHHYVYLDAKIPSATITSEPAEIEQVIGCSDFLRIVQGEGEHGLLRSRDLLRLTKQLSDGIDQTPLDLFFRNAALVVVLDQ